MSIRTEHRYWLTVTDDDGDCMTIDMLKGRFSVYDSVNATPDTGANADFDLTDLKIMHTWLGEAIKEYEAGTED